MIRKELLVMKDDLGAHPREDYTCRGQPLCCLEGTLRSGLPFIKESKVYIFLTTNVIIIMNLLAINILKAIFSNDLEPPAVVIVICSNRCKVSPL